MAKLDDLSRLRAKIKADSRYKKLKSVYTTNKAFDLPIDSFRADMQGLFKLRKFRDLDTRSPTFIQSLNEAYVQDLSYRSRMTETFATFNNARMYMDRLVDAFSDYVHSAYSNDLKIVGAAKERERFVATMLRPMLDYKAQLERACAEIELYVKDIDKAGFGATSMANAQVMLSKNGGRDSM